MSDSLGYRSLLIDSRSCNVDVFTNTIKLRTSVDRDPEISPGRRFIGNFDLQHARYSFEGQQLTTSRLKLENQKTLQFYYQGSQACLCRPFATGYDGLYTISNALLWSTTATWSKGSPYADTRLSYLVTFDSRTGELRQEFGTGTDSPEALRLNNSHFHITIWKDVRFSIQRRDVDVKTQTDAEP